MLKNFPYIEISGDAHERGLQHGSQLKERIHANIAFYKKIIKASEEDLLLKVKHFQKIIQGFNYEYAIEIDAIAEGASVDPVWVYMINARSELIDHFNECTSFFFKESSLLAQNWDWAETSENLVVVMRVTNENGNTFIHLTEPGMLGKIGFNDKGIGVCLNFLASSKPLLGIPVHILLRSVLDSQTFEEAKDTIKTHAQNTAGNLLIADAEGSYVNFEMSGEHIFEYDSDTSVVCHTNHFHMQDNKDPDKFANSMQRFKRANYLASNIQKFSIDEAKNILADKEDKASALCRVYHKNETIGNVGTIVSIVMDLSNKTLHITDGNPHENDYAMVRL
ncbi:hypothetical protein H6776_00880 [Candidatus Nomurabacteria bacterium]|nr:hypothetical protein [Candidatus Nomurabacteria bacterium]